MASRGARYRLRSAGREIELPARTCLIGRATDCQLRVENGLVSRRHARLRETEEGLVIEDLGSRNGVLVNQRAISKATLLYHGDTFSIGVQTFEIVDERLLSLPSVLSTLPPAARFDQTDAADGLQDTVLVRLEVLSAREREVLHLIALGHTQKEIAGHLHVSIKTVETHRARIGEKLACSTRSELVCYALCAGLLAPASGRGH